MTVKTALAFDDQVYAAIKHCAALAGMSIAAWVNQAVREAPAGRAQGVREYLAPGPRPGGGRGGRGHRDTADLPGRRRVVGEEALRGQVWEYVHGARTYRVLVVSGNEYNGTTWRVP